MLERLLEIGKQVLAERDLDSVLSRALDGLIELCGAERGMIVLEGDGGETRFEAARHLDRQDIERPEFEVSRTVLDKVRAEGVGFWSPNVLEDPSVGSRQSVLRLRILSVICLPIRRQEERLGLIYLDNRKATGVFTPETARLVESFADLISLAAANAIERRRLAAGIEELGRKLRAEQRFESILGHDPKLLAVLERVAQVADSDVPVLIAGESGTGKELIARALHFGSRRRERPFVAINCGALPEALLDSELFGHVRGAFTGAVADRAGWFERAQGGTILLDEAGEMPPSLQVKLLRVLENRELARVGSTTVKRTDARVVAATHRDLAGMVREGRFREDLLYRLNVVEIEMPPLRERPSDLPLLARTFLDRFNEKHGRDRRLSLRAERLLRAYGYPGNIRELQNAIERAVLISRGPEIGVEDLPEVMRTAGAADGREDGAHSPSSFRGAKQRVIEQFERGWIETALSTAKGNISEAARASGLDYKNFYAKMARYGIEPGAFKGGSRS
ncbi:MAG TPA: sigma-54-dependent Fis family transcriptional regulator [Thermoanaerobaculia bacterium]|jgi:transcriptional regulator with GAF, ATPase, and Fis domain|nr:sigma-54-dependent Fis family transcriptional regulator [Thermoanaerobaculia bacterium]